MLSRNSFVPLYQQIKELLKNEIAQTEPHTRLPGELELASRYQVSRGTVKQAIAALLSEGLVYRMKGKGTFVAPPQIHRSFDALPSFNDDISARGYTPSVLSISVDRIVPSETVQAQLKLAPGDLVWEIYRVRAADGEPVVVSTSYLPCNLVPEISREELGNGSMYKLMETKYGVRPRWARDRYTAVNADKTVAAILKIPPGKAVLYSERTSYLLDGCPIEYATGYIRGDKFVINVSINKPEQTGPEDSQGRSFVPAGSFAR